MAILDGAGTASGSSSASGQAAITFGLSETVNGASSASCVGGINSINSGQFLGSSEMLWDFFQDGAGTALGSSTASGSGHVLKSGRGVFAGTSFMVQSTLLPIWGTSFMSMAPQVQRLTKPSLSGQKTLRWNQLLQRGDLAIYFREGSGGISPIVVVYSLYFIRSDGSRQPVGPQNKSPVAGDVGEFYVAGRAGESGQPGCWVIEWKYQISTAHLLEVVEMPFLVLDAVLAQDPFDITDRRVKFGWN